MKLIRTIEDKEILVKEFTDIIITEIILIQNILILLQLLEKLLEYFQCILY